MFKIFVKTPPKFPKTVPAPPFTFACRFDIIIYYATKREGTL
jgi:hypothetical protein